MIEIPTGRIIVECPTCGSVLVKPDVFDLGKSGSEGTPVGGICPECDERLYFAENN